jgi:endoglucanase
MESSLIRRLEAFSQAIAPSGAEADLLLQIERTVAPFCDRYERDALGNLICYRNGSDPSLAPLLLCAHADEVGFLVSEICDDGSLAFSCVGGIDDAILCGKSVTITTKNGALRGVIFEKPLHLMPRADRTAVPKADDLRIDIGATDKEGAKALVDLGDYGVMDGPFCLFGKSLCMGKALDDRLGCAILCEVLETLATQNIRTPYPLCIAFTVREEVGLSGAITLANRVRPACAIILETTAIADLPSVASEKQVAHLGEGGVLSLMDRSTVYDRPLLDFLFELADRKKIKAQVKKYISGGNDAGHIHKSRAGVKCAALSAPCRYLHSPSCVLDTRDAQAMLDLVLAFLQEEKAASFLEVANA